jgi:esterase/lipase superfamily enzyme
MKFLPILLLILLAACSSRVNAPLSPEAKGVGLTKDVFVGTTRLLEFDGQYGFGRDAKLSLLRYSVSIPENRDLGSIKKGLSKPKPGRDFILVDRIEYPTSRAFQKDIWDDVESSPNRGGHDATIYVHGYNNSFSDSVFRVAQLTHDLNIAGPAISYAWPSRGTPLGYEYDRDSALFARDGLVKLMRDVKASGVRRIVLVAHSLGSSLVMESLRHLELTDPGWASQNISGVLLISPDLNVDVFRAQAASFKRWPQPFIIFSSRRDVILRLSARIRGERSRLGNLRDINDIADLPVSFVDVTALSEETMNKHFVAGTSDTFIRILRSAGDLDQAFLRGHTMSGISGLGSQRVVQRATEFVFLPGER